MVQVMFTLFNTLVGTLLGSLVLLVTYLDATKIKKFHDKRQITPPYMFQPQQSRLQSQYPLTRAYFPAPGYQYNPAFKNSGQTMKPPPSAFVASAYSQAFKPQPRGQYVSYYYPHRTHYRDWSLKVLKANDYARKWQIARKQKYLLRRQKANQGDTGIKLFVAGINKNGNVQGKWIAQNHFKKPNDQKKQELVRNKPPHQNVAASITHSATNVNIGLSSNNPSDPKHEPQLVANSPSYTSNQHSQTQAGKTNALSSNANSVAVAVGANNLNLPLQTQTSSLLDKGSTTNVNLNGGILSDNLGGAVLGPNAHSLLQSATSQQTPESGTPGNHQGRVGVSELSNANLPSKTNSLQNYAPPKTRGESVYKNLPNNNIPGQEKGRNIHSSNDQHPQPNKVPGNVQSDTISLPQNNTGSSPPSDNLSAIFGHESRPKAAYTPVTDVTSAGRNQGGQSGTTPQMKTPPPTKGLVLDPVDIDKDTAQKLNTGLLSISPSRPQSQDASVSQPPNATPNNKNVASRNRAPGNINPNQTPLNRELALKNILFPPPAAIINQPSGSSPRAFQKNVSPQQIVPSFPAFRYDANVPSTGQTGSFNSYRRNNMPFPTSVTNNRKSLVPYKSSFPLMLHKISPYFKIKRNLKQRMTSGQAKARRRFLELQTVK